MKHAELWKRILHQRCIARGHEGWRFVVAHRLKAAKSMCDSSESRLNEVHRAIDRIPKSSGNDYGKEFSNAVIADTIICDTQDISIDHPDGWEAVVGKPIALPLDTFWVEYPKYNDILIGAHCLCVPSHRVDGWTCLSIAPVLALDGIPPTLQPWVFVHIDGSGVIREVRNDYSKHSHADTNVASNRISHLVCQTAMLMSCKNVDLSPRDNRPRDMRIAAKRHGGKPEDYRYHVLTVRPAGSKPGTPGIEIGNMPRHVCRGHFAEYGPEYGKGLLFGKLAGRFYVPPHMKGDKKNGTVAKDYRVVSDA